MDVIFSECLSDLASNVGKADRLPPVMYYNAAMEKSVLLCLEREI